MKVGVSLRSAYRPRWIRDRRPLADRAHPGRSRGRARQPVRRRPPQRAGALLPERRRCSAACSPSGTTGRPARCSCLPLWHPVLLAEQIGTLASIARARSSCSARSAAAPSSSTRVRRRRCATACRGSKPRSTSSAGSARAKKFDSMRRGASTGRASRPFRPSRSRCGSVPRPPKAIDRAARLGDAFLIGPEATPAKFRELVDAYREACAAHGRTRRSHRGPPRRARRRRRRRRRAVAGPILDRGYRGFDPSAPVVGGAERVAAAFAALGAAGCTDVIIRHLADDHDEVLRIVRTCAVATRSERQL